MSLSRRQRRCREIKIHKNVATTTSPLQQDVYSCRECNIFCWMKRRNASSKLEASTLQYPRVATIMENLKSYTRTTPSNDVRPPPLAMHTLPIIHHYLVRERCEVPLRSDGRICAHSLHAVPKLLRSSRAQPKQPPLA